MASFASSATTGGARKPPGPKRPKFQNVFERLGPGTNTGLGKNSFTELGP